MSTSRLDKLRAMHEADPTDADVPYMIAQERAKEGAHEEAIAWFDKCLEIDPSYHYAYYHKARSQQAAGEPLHAVDTLHVGREKAAKDNAQKAVSEIDTFLAELEG